eukprot:m.88317 g.88317  ORF g.88317 m.88317 type:complete len:516 (-) comp9748_c0_seq1:204-1751(-)
MSTNDLFEEGIQAIAVCKVAFDSTDVVELSLAPGDRVLITRTDVGSGWLEGMKVGGDTIGLFPEAYVDLVERPDTDKAADAPSAEKKPVLADSNPFAVPAPARSESPEIDEAAVMARAARLFSESDTTSPKRVSISSGDFSTGPTILPGFKWKRESAPFEVKVVKAENRGTKFKGIKQFTVFKVTDTRTNVAVERRFKHFTWLHEQLARIYPNFIIPHLPGKQVAGRFEQEFIERRRRGLEHYLHRLSQHPVLGSSAILLHFLTADDHKNWKAGKRLSEQFPPVADSITVKDGLEQVDMAEILTRTSAFMEWLGKRLAEWHDAGEGLSASFHALSGAFEKMGTVLMKFAGPTATQPEYTEWWDGGKTSGEVAGVLMGLARFGSGIERIASLIREHQEQHSITLLEFLKQYSELTKSIPTFPGQKPSRKSGGDKSQSTSPRPRGASTSATEDVEDDGVKQQVLLAELRFFHEQLLRDFKSLIHEFIQEQIAFHKQAATTWESLVPDFEGLLHSQVA